VAGQTPRALTAFANLKKICEEHVKCKYEIEVIDLLKNPQLAKGDQILAVPTLVRKLPCRYGRSSATYPIRSGCWLGWTCGQDADELEHKQSRGDTPSLGT